MSLAGKVKSIELYEEANLSTQVLSNIRRAHFEEPTTIQRYALPCIRQQDDLMACAQTGSGKTVCDDLNRVNGACAEYLGGFSLANYFQFIGVSC